MITIIIAACLLYCSASSVCSASDGHTNSLLSKQEINPPIPSMADLDQDPDMPALMNSDGGPCTKWQLDALMRKMEAYKAYVEAGGDKRSDPGVFKDAHGFWRTSDGYISLERPPEPIIISPRHDNNRLIVFDPPSIESPQPEFIKNSSPLSEVLEPSIVPKIPELPSPYLTNPPHDSWKSPQDLSLPQGSSNYGLRSSVSRTQIPRSTARYEAGDRLFLSQLRPDDFEALCADGIFNKQTILYDYELYGFSQFLIFARKLPQYEQFILDLEHKIDSNKKFSDNTFYINGFGSTGWFLWKKSGFHEFVRKEASRVRQQIKKKCEEKAKKEVEVQRKKQEEAEKRQRLADELREKDHQERELVEIVALADNGLLHQEYSEQLIEEFSDEWDQLNDPKYERILRRHKALEAVIMNSALKTTRRYALDEVVTKNGDKETVGYCQELHGTAYQHVLQEEFNELYEKSCRWRTEYNGRENLSTYEFLHNMLEAGIGFNHHNFDGKATLVADCCWGLVQGGGLGLFHSVAAKAPVLQPLYRLQSSVFLGTLIAGTIYFAGDVCLATCTGNTERRDALLGIFSDGIAALKKTSRRDAIRNLTAFGVELAFSGKINNAARNWLTSANKKLASKFPGYNKAFSSVQDLLMNIDADLQVAVQAADMLRSNAFTKLSKNAAKKLAKKAEKQAAKAAAAPPPLPLDTPQSAMQQFIQVMKKRFAQNIPQPQRLLDAQGKQVLTPCGRPVIELGGYKFADLYDHEYQKILDMFKNHVSGVTLTKERIQHIVFGEFSKKGMHKGGHLDIGGYALKNNQSVMSLIEEQASGALRVSMRLPWETIEKGYFPRGTDPMTLFKKMSDELSTADALRKLQSISHRGLRFQTTIKSFCGEAEFTINQDKNIISCYPKITEGVL